MESGYLLKNILAIGTIYHLVPGSVQNVPAKSIQNSMLKWDLNDIPKNVGEGEFLSVALKDINAEKR